MKPLLDGVLNKYYQDQLFQYLIVYCFLMILNSLIQLYIKLKKNKEKVYYLQKLEDIKIKSVKKWQDFRILVCDNKIIASMIRKNKKKITNIGQGGKAFNFNADEKIKKISINAAKLVAADYAGIDLIKDRYGNYKVIEINSVPAWKGLQKTTDKNIASILAKTFVKKLK